FGRSAPHPGLQPFPTRRSSDLREEMQRMFQNAGLVYADVVSVAGTSPADLDEKAFQAYFNRRYGKNPDYAGLTVEQLLQNLGLGDRKSTRLNSSHVKISYAVFC